jgi:predicted PurR-regulated permease PerM
MDEEKAPQEDSQEKLRAKNEAAPARPEVSGPTKVAGWAGAPTSQVVLLVFVLVYQQVESNLLQPLVYSQAVQFNGLVILIALLVGGQLLGIPGALLAIPVAEIICIVLTELRDYRCAEQGASETAVASSPPPATSE